MNSERDLIYSRIKDALAPLCDKCPLPDFADELVRMRQAINAGDLWQTFTNRIRAVNGLAFSEPKELAAFLADKGWIRGYCDPSLWPALSPCFDARFQVSSAFDRRRVDNYEFGITRGAGAIAETGSIILADTTTSSRLAALAPWVHVALFKRSEIFPDLPAAVSALGADPNVIWATGPSKTADVEGILIEGVHGPGVQIGLLMD